MRSIIITILISFLLSLFSFAQNKCGTVFTEDDKKRISEIRTEGSKMSKRSGELLEFKVQPFIIRNPDTEEVSIDPSKLFSLEIELNDAFKNSDIQFHFCTHQFVDCKTLFDIDKTEYELLSSLKTNRINIFFVSSIGGDSSIGVYHLESKIIIVGKDLIGDIMIHEMGHYFGLQHTFSEVNPLMKPEPLQFELLDITPNKNPVENLDGENCENRADGFCSTPADYLAPNFIALNDIQNCDDVKLYHESLRRFQTWENYYPPIYNYMSYYPDCPDEFTREQKNAMYLFADKIFDEIDYYCFSNDISVVIPDFCEQKSKGGFICNGFCHIGPSNDYLSINCGALETKVAEGTVTVSAPQISNKSNVSISNFKIEYSLISNENHLLGIKSYTNTIEPGKTITPNGSFFHTNKIPSGYYKLQVRLVSDLSINQSCISNDEFFIGIPDTSPPNPPESCPANILVNGYHTYLEARDYILAPTPGKSITLRENQNSTIDAGKYIDLKPGFTAEYNSRFDAFIDGCGGISNPKISNPNARLKLRNYPNPFTRETSIEFELRNEKPVTLFVTDMMGKKVATLLNNEQQSQGIQTITFNGKDHLPGIYYYTLQVGDDTKTQKMILMR